MKKALKTIKNNKLLFTLILIMIIFLIIGVLYPAILSSNNKELIKSSLNQFFLSISKDKLHYLSALITSLSNNIIITLIIWLLGISIIGIPLIMLIFIFKSFILGFSISSIITVYKLRGVLFAIIYIIPLVINLMISYILCYYAISFSIMIFNYLFRKKEYNRKAIVKRYIKILIFSIIIFILSSLIEVFIIPSIFKYII